MRIEDYLQFVAGGLWMVMLWVSLALTLNVSMAWLRGRNVLAALFGAMTRLLEPSGLLAIALLLLYGLVKLLYGRFPGMSTS